MIQVHVWNRSWANKLRRSGLFVELSQGINTSSGGAACLFAVCSEHRMWPLARPEFEWTWNTCWI